MVRFRNPVTDVVFTSVLIIVTSLELVDCCCLVSSPWCFDWYDAFSMMFGCPISTPRLRFNRKAQEWTTRCPDVGYCEYGVDRRDYDMCPACLLGPGKRCGEWLGQCGDDMICQYSGIFACTGKCVLKSEFYSRKRGEKCGELHGRCGSDLQCQKKPFNFCDFYGGGVCVTDEEFKSLGAGDMCGGMLGQCGTGLQCTPRFFSFCFGTCKVEHPKSIESLSTSEEDNDKVVVDSISSLSNGNVHASKGNSTDLVSSTEMDNGIQISVEVTSDGDYDNHEVLVIKDEASDDDTSKTDEAFTDDVTIVPNENGESTSSDQSFVVIMTQDNLPVNRKTTVSQNDFPTVELVNGIELKELKDEEFLPVYDISVNK